jgi:hypothetical protein
MRLEFSTTRTSSQKSNPIPPFIRSLRTPKPRRASFSLPDNGLWVSFDDTEIAKRKVDYIKQLGLGGGMFWELSGDTKDTATSLLEVLYRGLKK